MLQTYFKNISTNLACFNYVNVDNVEKLTLIYNKATYQAFYMWITMWILCIKCGLSCR